jgi:hypothetical protein
MREKIAHQAGGVSMEKVDLYTWGPAKDQLDGICEIGVTTNRTQ